MRNDCPREIEVASPTGFCFGVKRAIESLEKSIDECSARREGHRKVYSIGMPIHNPQEVERLTRKGLVVVDRIEDVPPGASVFIRAHGVSPAVKDALVKRCGSGVTDATCPFVKNAQEKAALLSREGYPVLVLGDPGHPEVQAIVGCAGGEVFVASSLAEVEKLCKKDRLGVISQTTQKSEVLGAAAKILAPRIRELRIFNTICGATTQRQEAVRKITGHVDGLLVVGGKNSANTAKLVEIAQSRECDVLWIEQAKDVDCEWFRGKKKIGIAAGASTPDWIINELINAIETSQVSRGMEDYDGRNEK